MGVQGGTMGLAPSTSGIFGTGLSGGNALLLGSAGLTLASAFSSQGSSFQDKIRLSSEGKALQKDYATTAKETLDKRKAGDVNDLAFSDVHALKMNEGARNRGFQGAAQALTASIDNQGPNERGGITKGGNTVRALAQGAGERAKGLFAPTSTLNNYRREGLLNAVKDVGNRYALDNQVASCNYGGRLAEWQASNDRSANQGAAIGSVASMIGSSKMNNEYYKYLDRVG